MIDVEDGHNRSKRVLLRKGKVYATEDGDRLDQFHRAGEAQGIGSAQALIGMVTRHFISITDMAKCPLLYSRKQWNERIVDLRNYTHLLDALLRDLGVE